MILHIVDNEKFLEKTITTFETIYPNKNSFLVGEEGRSFNDLNALKARTQLVNEKINTESYNRMFLEMSEKVSLIIFHNLYKTYKLELINKYKGIVKVAWVFWGAELYGLNPKYNSLLPFTEAAYMNSLPFVFKIKKGIFSRLKKRHYWTVFKKALSTKIDYVLTNLEEDINLLESFTNTSNKRGWFSYYSIDAKSIETNLSLYKRNILIGNSSSETNNHFDTFNILSKKELIDQKLYIPLTYGDKKYGQLVINKAKVLFGEHAMPMTDFLTLSEYTKIIDSCAVLIMNHTRQQAFNTIMIAIARGCKVFLREENSIYNALRKEGFIIFSIQNDIEKETAFDSLSIQDQTYNLNLIKEKYSDDVVIQKIKVQIQQILKDEY